MDKETQAPIAAAAAIENELCLFPLFTKKALSERWGKSYSVINHWETRHDNFPARISGLIVGGDREGKGGGPSSSLYPAREVFRYEKERGIRVVGNDVEQLEPWGWNEDEPF